jgi:hypothetical protein
MFDRSKYENRVIKQETVEVQTVQNPDNKRSDYAPVLYSNKLPDGNIVMNILPPHNPDLSYFQQCSTSMLEVEKTDNTGNKALGKKAIFSGEVHSKSGRCIIKEYIKMAEKLIKQESMSAVEMQSKLDLIYGSYERKVNGIVPSPTFPMYVHLSGNKGLEKGDGVYKLMANYTIKNRLVEIENANQEVNQPMKVDIYTSPSDGTTINIAIDPKAAGKDKYKVDPRMKRVPVSDESYEFWLTQKPLDELYVDSYTSKDFDLAIEGLSNFDEKSKFNVFAQEEFLTICEELSELYPKVAAIEPHDLSKTVVEEEKPSSAQIKWDKEVKEKEEDLEKLPWDKKKEEPMVRHDTPVTAPSATMTTEEKAANLAALRARLKK